MKEKLVSILMLALILTSTLSMAFIIRPSLAENGFPNENFMEKNRETGLPNLTNKPDQASIFNNDWRNIFERRLGAGQGENLESPSQTSRLSEDKWNFSDTSEWSNFTYVDGNKTRLIVGVNDKNPASLLELERIAAAHQAKIIDTVSIGGEVRAVVVELLLVSVTAFVEETRVMEWASYIEPNMKVQALFVPNDPYWSMQWGPQKIEADWAWNTTVGDSSVLVAVVDTGIDYTHTDLAANYVALGYDWANNDNDPMDDHGHGTHCAGIIAAVLDNSVGIAGLAQVRVMAEKVLTSGGSGYDDWIANGIINATDSGADIISMSLGGYGDSQLLHDAVKYAYDAGVLVIAAAGNDNTNMKLYPAGYDEVIAVAATDQSDNKAGFSNWGDWIELAAPGVSIYSTVPWGYESWSGTSMACPHVSGVAALVWSRYPSKARDWVRLWLRYTADDLGDPGFDVYYGYGRINARKAVEQTPPPHELIVSNWVTPPYVRPGALETINATILNFGENNETDVAVQLLANDTVVDSTLIGFLVSGNSATVSLTWNPTGEGLYNVTLYVVPMPGETSVENNVVWKYIYVGSPVKAVVLHSAGNIQGNIITNWQALNSEWRLFGGTMVYIDYTTLNKEDITYEDIVATEADVLIISCAYDPYAGWEFTDSEIEAITRYVHEGHGLIVTAGTLYYQVPNNNKLAPLFGLNETTMWTGTGTDLLHLVNATHPIFADVPNPLVFPQVGTALPYDGRWDSNELVEGKYLALGHYNESAIVTFKGLVYISPWLEVVPPYYHHHLQLLYNAIMWSRYQKPEHELVVSLEDPRYLQPGESALLNATVSNMGLNNETDVELYLLIDGTIVNSTTIPELLVGASHRINYFWAPTLQKTYNITAYSPPLPGEEITLNNVDSGILSVRFVRFVLWDDTKDADGDSLTGNYLSLYQLLAASGFIADELTIGPINSEVLAHYDILVLMDPELDFSPSEIADIQNWVASGGALIVIPDGGYPPTINTLMAPYGVQMTGMVSWYGPTTNIVSHPITQGVSSIWVDGAREISATTPSTILAWTADFYAFLSATEAGEVVVASDSNIMDNERLGMADNTQLMLDIFNWVGIKPEHDLAVSLEAPTFLEPGNSVVLNTTVRNRGLNNETHVELQLIINSTTVNSTVIPELPIGNSFTLSYLWTPSEGIYNVTAYAPPVPNEEYTENNFASVNVRVRYVIARVAVLNSSEIPSYFVGGWSNNYQLLVDALNAHGFYAQAVTNQEIIHGTLSFFDVFVMIDNVPSDAAVPYVVAFWSNRGGLVAFDSSICFLCYAGILPPESSGSNGSYVYWDYGSSSQAKISAEHPVTAGYEVGQIIYGAGGDAEYWVDALAGTSAYPYYTMLAEDLTRPNRAYVSAYEPSMAGNVVHIWDYSHWSNTNLQLMILNAMEWANAPQYEHEVVVSLDAPLRLNPSDSVLLNATVRNRGLDNETNVELYLLINGTVINSAMIPELRVNESHTISCLWAPAIESLYNITAYAPPVFGENQTRNNVVSKMVPVKYIIVALISDYSQLSAITYILDSMGITYDIYNDNNIYLYTENLNLLLNYKLVIFNNYDRMITSNEHSALESYLASDGNLILTGYDSLGHPDDPLLADIVRSSSFGDNVGEPDLIVVDAAHPIMNGPYGIFPLGYHITGLFSDCDAAEADTTRGAATVAELADSYDKIIATQTAGGKVVYWNGEGASDWTLNTDCQAMFKNMIDWIIMRPVHDLAVSVLAPSYLELNEPFILRAIVGNIGLSNETDIDLQLLINGAIVASSTISNLSVSSSYTLSHLWVPTAEGIYNVTAYAPPLTNETRTANNIASEYVSVLAIHGTSLRVKPKGSIAIVDRNFTISINVVNVTNLIGYQFYMYYDTRILDGLEIEVPPDHFLAPTDPSNIYWAKQEITDNFNATHGRIIVCALLLPPESPKNGSGVLVNITFKASALGSSILHLAHTRLADPSGVEIPHIALDGSVEVVSELPADVAIVSVTTSTTMVYEGRVVNITVVARNEGNTTETFSVTAYYDSSVIGTQLVVDLPPGENITLTFNWNTTGLAPCHSYIITAYAWFVPGEIDTGDNILSDGAVKIAMLGDVNADGIIDLLDLVKAANAFGAISGSPDWNPQADIWPDNLIDIFDLVNIALRFGQHC